MQSKFPFPGRSVAMRELSSDPCYEKIAPKDRSRIVDEAWERGRRAAQEEYGRMEGLYDFYTVFGVRGVQILERDIDCVVGSQRYFSDYLSGKNRVTLYIKSIALWAQENGLEVSVAKNLILSHEYFHYLECHELGLTSRMYQVPMLRVGGFEIGHTGVHALSEIGAHAFARAYYELAHGTAR